MNTPPPLLPENAGVATQQSPQLLCTVSEDPNKVHIMSESSEGLPLLSELDIKISQQEEEQNEENQNFEDNKKDFVLMQSSKSHPSSIDTHNLTDLNSSLLQVPLFSLHTNNLHEKNSPIQETTLELKILSTKLPQTTDSGIDREEFMAVETSYPLPALLELEKQISLLRTPPTSQDDELITQSLSCPKNACTTTESKTPGPLLQLHELDPQLFSPKHHPIEEDDKPIPKLFSCPKDNEALCTTKSSGSPLLEPSLIEENIETADKNAFLAVETYKTLFPLVDSDTHNSSRKKSSYSQDDKSITESSPILEENQKACMNTKSSGTPIQSLSINDGMETSVREMFEIIENSGPPPQLHERETKNSSSKQLPIEHNDMVITESLHEPGNNNTTTKSSWSLPAEQLFLKDDNETPKLVDLAKSSTKVMDTILSPIEILLQKESPTMAISSIEQTILNSPLTEPITSLQGGKNAEVFKTRDSIEAELPLVQSILSQDKMEIDVVVESHNLSLSSTTTDVSETSLVPPRQDVKKIFNVARTPTSRVHGSSFERNSTNDENIKVQELVPSLLVSDFSESSPTRQPSSNGKKESRKAIRSFKAASSKKVYTGTKNQRSRPPTRSSTKLQLEDPSSESSLIHHFQTLLMGRSRGNFNADEDPSQRSRRKRNAAEGDHSESSVAGQVAPVGKKALYHCNYCNKDITGRIRIKCAVCPDFDLCVECFSVGAEVHPHKSNHPYRVIDNLSFPILSADWNAEEETLLLEGIEMYGMGNWAEIAEHVGTKVRDFCVQHYKTAYMDSACFPLPDMAFCNGKNRAELLAMAKEHGDGISSVGETSLNPESPFSSTGIKKEDSLKNGSSSRSHSNPNADNMSDRTTRDKNLKTSMELCGYNPKRHEFDVEYDNDAEQLLVDMEFNDTDTPEERETKLRILRIYNKRLDERQRRKDFIIERNLLQPSPFEEGLSAEEKELCHRYDCFMRFHSREKHEKLLETVVKEHRILKRINEIKEARAAGCRSPDEARRYLERKRKLDAEENGGSRTENAQPSSSSQRGFDITAYPESNLLTNYEKRVCCELKLTPPDYLRMQEVLSKLIFMGRISKKSDSSLVFKNVEQIKVDWVYDMLVKKGIANP